MRMLELCCKVLGLLLTHFQASPQKKLPAFYVLDSVVKNVGTPYTLFFGRQLYSTFMEAYALVDNSTRRKMDEMLKTWKEPVPGSMDTRPVFPPEITRPIENALIKARTSALQQEQMRSQQQGFGRGRPVVAPYRETPTPPGVARQPVHGPPGYASTYQQYPPPPGAGQQQYPPAGSQQFSPPSSQAYPPTPVRQYTPNSQNYPPNSQQYPPDAQQYPPNSQQYPPPTNQQYPPPNNQSYQPNNVQQYPSPNGQQYVGHPDGPQPHGLPQVSIRLPFCNVTKLMEVKRPPSQQYTQQPAPAPSWQHPSQGYGTPENSVDTLNRDIADLITTSKADFAKNPWDNSIQTRLKALLDLQTILSSQQLPPDQIVLIKNQVAQLSEAAHSSTLKVAASQPTPPPAPVAAAQQPSLSSLLGPGALAALLARQSTTPQPTPSQSTAPIRSPPPSAQPTYNPPSGTPSTSTSLPDPGSLLERLRAAGILQGAPPTSTPTSLSAALPGKIPPGFPPPPFINTPPNSSRTPLAEIPNDVILKPASLKL